MTSAREQEFRIRGLDHLRPGGHAPLGFCLVPPPAVGMPWQNSRSVRKRTLENIQQPTRASGTRQGGRSEWYLVLA